MDSSGQEPPTTQHSGPTVTYDTVPSTTGNVVTGTTKEPSSFGVIPKELGSSLLHGGGGKWRTTLTPFPLWGQLIDWTAKGENDNNSQYNCGPESIAMVLKYLTGIELPAYYIKDVETSMSYVGDTTTVEMVHYFTTLCETKVTEHVAQSKEHLAWLIWKYLHDGKPLIWLRSFASPTDTVYHFAPIVYADNNMIGEADPWTAQMKYYTYDEAYSWFAGWLLGIERTRSIA